MNELRTQSLRLAVQQVARRALVPGESCLMLIGTDDNNGAEVVQAYWTKTAEMLDGWGDHLPKLETGDHLTNLCPDCGRAVVVLDANGGEVIALDASHNACDVTDLSATKKRIATRPGVERSQGGSTPESNDAPMRQAGDNATDEQAATRGESWRADPQPGKVVADTSTNV